MSLTHKVKSRVQIAQYLCVDWEQACFLFVDRVTHISEIVWELTSLHTLLAYLQMAVDSHLETTANHIHQESYNTVEHPYKWEKDSTYYRCWWKSLQHKYSVKMYIYNLPVIQSSSGHLMTKHKSPALIVFSYLCENSWQFKFIKWLNYYLLA